MVMRVNDGKNLSAIVPRDRKTMQTTQDRAEISFGRQSPARSHVLLMSRLDVYVDYEVLHARKEGESIPLSALRLMAVLVLEYL